MEIEFGSFLSMGFYFFTLYCAIYFLYTYFKRDKEEVSTLFQPGISVIIPAYNEEDNIKRAIDSCLNQDYKGSIEVIVVDDGSTDKTRSICRDYEKKGLIKLVLKNKPGSPTGKISSVNLGIKLAKHSLISILDADSFLELNVFLELVGYFENDKVGAAVPLQKVYKPKSLIERLQSIEYTVSFCIRKLLSLTDSLFITHGVGCIFKKAALKKVGYFEENTLTEDLNIGLKLIKEGFTMRSSFKAIGYTVVPNNLKQLSKQRLRWNGGLCENFYWFKNMIMNKSYGNLGLFAIPINIAWTGLMIYFLVQILSDALMFVFERLSDLLLTSLDWQFVIDEAINLNLIKINSLYPLNILATSFFIIFYWVVSKRIGFTNKQVITNIMLLPFYFTIYFFLLSLFWLLTPFYLIKNGGVGWSVRS